MQRPAALVSKDDEAVPRLDVERVTRLTGNDELTTPVNRDGAHDVIPMGAAWSKVSVAATIPAALRSRPMAVMMCCVHRGYLPCHRMLPYSHYTRIFLIILIYQYHLEFL